MVPSCLAASLRCDRSMPWLEAARRCCIKNWHFFFPRIKNSRILISDRKKLELKKTQFLGFNSAFDTSSACVEETFWKPWISRVAVRCSVFRCAAVCCCGLQKVYTGKWPEQAVCVGNFRPLGAQECSKPTCHEWSRDTCPLRRRRFQKWRAVRTHTIYTWSHLYRQTDRYIDKYRHRHTDGHRHRHKHRHRRRQTQTDTGTDADTDTRTYTDTDTDTYTHTHTHTRTHTHTHTHTHKGVRVHRGVDGFENSVLFTHTHT